ncbi:MAG: peptidylprolyl isomerase [Bacteroidales bacterium]|nr:peptidylprolyl isomerase [Bacteroidales bacterium]
MIKKVFLLSLMGVMGAVGMLCSSVQAQTWPVDDPVVIEVNGQKIRQSEFMKEFMNSVGDKLSRNPQTPEAEKRQALREYVNLFANFRAKVVDARSMGFDTVESLRTELAKYRNELAAPYLIDSAVLENILREAYERNHRSLHVAHIINEVAPDAKPEDTLKVYNHMIELRNRIMAGEDFYAVSREEVYRRNPSPNLRQDEGNLGYFTAFDMVYPFENAAYGLKVGEVSMPVRTRYGYHLIKLHDYVELHGKCDIAHLWVGTRDSVVGQGAINAMYQSLLDGQDFDKVARQSDDRTTNENGGRIMNAALNQLPPEYLHVIAGLKAGEYSKPFHTQYGWHIVKLIRKDTLPPYEAMVPYYKQKLTRDQRGDASRKVFATNCRAKYGLVDLTKTPMEQPATKKRGKKSAEPVKMQASLDNIYSIVPRKVAFGKWDYDDSLVKDIQPLVRVMGKEYNSLDFARYINTHREAFDLLDIVFYVNMRYEEFMDSIAVKCADERLEADYPEFAEVVEEYRRGLMIFSYNDKMVWSKAIQDSAGFADFYNRASKTKRMNNRADSVYFWNVRARITKFDIADSALLAPEKAVKILTKAQKKSTGSREMKALLEKAIGKKAKSENDVTMLLDLVEMGHTDLIGEDQWKVGVYTSANRKGYSVLMVDEVLPPSLKAQMEARGYYLNEYQNELERNLCDSLREKYNVKINWDVVNQIRY